MIFFRKDPVNGVELESAINNAVFPGLQVEIFTIASLALLDNFSLDVFKFFLCCIFLGWPS